MANAGRLQVAALMDSIPYGIDESFWDYAN
jgi:hypothetical protein